MTTTITPVLAIADLLTVRGEKRDTILPLKVTIEDGMLTLGTYGGPDLWRAKLEDLL
jgi:hypothetical protein